MGTVVALGLNALLMMALPIVVAVVVRRLTKARFTLLLAGALAFIGSQIVHLPILWGWSALTQAHVIPAFGAVPNAIVLGALAGLCEEPARALVFWKVFPRDRGRDAALFVGAGHGGIEALIFGGLALLSAINLYFLREMTPEGLILLGSPAEAAEAAIAQVRAALAAPWYEAFAGAFERAITIPFHVACSVLVMASFRRRSVLPFLVALLAHAGIDTAAVLLAGAHLGTWLTELVLAAIAVPASVGVLAWAWRAEPAVVAEDAPAPAPIPASSSNERA